MKAFQINRIRPVSEGTAPLDLADLPIPEPAEGEILIRVSACAVCHTELDEIEGRTPPPALPVIPGHQVVGRVEAAGRNVRWFSTGDRVGAAWIYSACGVCRYCKSGQENLCPDFKATGRDANGGYAEWMVIPEAFAYPIPEYLPDVQAAPLLCAGAVGYRSYRLADIQPGQALGLAGFGASAHLILQVARYLRPDVRIYAFSRSEPERAFARQLGAAWAGDFAEEPPEKLDRIIDTTPAWKPVLESLRHLASGGRLVINAIRKESIDQEELLGLDYARHLWMEKEIKSAANVTRRDVAEFLSLAEEMGIQPEVQEYALEDANRALLDLKARKIRGAKVLRMQ